MSSSRETGPTPTEDRQTWRGELEASGSDRNPPTETGGGGYPAWYPPDDGPVGPQGFELVSAVTGISVEDLKATPKLEEVALWLMDQEGTGLRLAAALLARAVAEDPALEAVFRRLRLLARDTGTGHPATWAGGAIYNGRHLACLCETTWADLAELAGILYRRGLDAGELHDLGRCWQKRQAWHDPARLAAVTEDLKILRERLAKERAARRRKIEARRRETVVRLRALLRQVESESGLAAFSPL